MSASRLLLVMPFGLALREGRLVLALAWLGLAVATDVVDGALARRLRSCTGFGGYLDATADFAIVLIGLLGLSTLGFPRWPQGVVIAMFVQFLLSSPRNRPRYDPVGKFYGGLLFGVIAVAITLPDLAVWSALADFILAITLVSFVSRVDSLNRRSAQPTSSTAAPEMEPARSRSSASLARSSA